MKRHGVLRGALIAALAVVSFTVFADISIDLGKHADGLAALRGYRASSAGAPASASEIAPGRKLLFERTYLRDGLMLRFYGMLFTDAGERANWLHSQDRSMSGPAIDVTDASFRDKGIRLLAYGSRHAPARTAR